MLALSARSGALSARIGPRLQMTVGPLIVGAGLALLTRATDPGSYWTQVFPAVLLFAFGLAVTVAPLTSTAMGAAPAEHSGIASAVNNVVARAAGLLAVAVLPLLAGLTGAAALERHRAGRRLPHRDAHLRRALRRRRRPGRPDHPQPRPRPGAASPEEPCWSLRRQRSPDPTRHWLAAGDAPGLSRRAAGARRRQR